MKKTIKKVLMPLLLACVIFFTISLSGCTLSKILKTPSYDECIECGDFIYRPKQSEEGDPTEAIVYGLSNAGKEKIGVIIPEEVDGLKVVAVNGHYWETGTDRKIKIFITHSFNLALVGGFHSNTSISFNIHDSFVSVWGSSTSRCDYGPRGSTFAENISDEEYYKVYKNQCYAEYANVTYGYNYEDAPYLGIYWIDDYDGTTIDFIPPDPVRDGYTFEGWYKDEECTEKWDFEKDIIPEKKYNITKRDDGTERAYYIYENNILYAKWRKNA